MVKETLDLDIGPVTAEDHERHQFGLPWDLLETNAVDDDDGFQIGEEETCREVYYSMRVRYCRRLPDQVECFTDTKFFINYLWIS